MNIFLCKSAESLIFNLKRSVDDIFANYGSEALLDSLIYADREYGDMQRAELREIMKVLAGLKKHVDGLSSDCENFPPEFRGPDEAWQKIS